MEPVGGRVPCGKFPISHCFIFLRCCCFFSAVPLFNIHDGPVFNFPHFEKLSGLTTLSAVGLGFLLALLIFIDQSIVISLTHVPEHK